MKLHKSEPINQDDLDNNSTIELVWELSSQDNFTQHSKYTALKEETDKDYRWVVETDSYPLRFTDRFIKQYFNKLIK